MLWKEDEDLDTLFIVPDDVVDLVFSIDCKSLPVDHTCSLASEIERHLPWFAAEKRCALHLIHVAESGNGWERPEKGTAQLYLSRRTKLILRMPKERVEAAKELTGKNLRIEGGYSIKVGKADIRKLADSTALYSRYVDTSHNESEEEFIDRAVAEIHAMGLEFKKILAGKAHIHKCDDQEMLTRSLFIADLGRMDSVRLQEQGIGTHQNLGFGVFIPHKTLK